MSKWRVVKKAVHRQYSYVGLEFNLESGDASMVKLGNRMTTVRKRKTSQFEALENGEWIGMPTKDAPSLLHDFNLARKKNDISFITECEVLNMLYKIDYL